MRSFKEIAEELQKQSEAFNGINSLDVKIISFELVHELSSILGEKGQHIAGICLFDAWSHLKNQKDKEDENQENCER